MISRFILRLTQAGNVKYSPLSRKRLAADWKESFRPLTFILHTRISSPAEVTASASVSFVSFQWECIILLRQCIILVSLFDTHCLTDSFNLSSETISSCRKHFNFGESTHGLEFHCLINYMLDVFSCFNIDLITWFVFFKDLKKDCGDINRNSVRWHSSC